MLKLAIMVTFSFLLIAVGALLYPLDDPYERRYVNTSEVTEIGAGYRLEYDLPESSLELSSAVITLCSCNETVAVYHLHNGTRERLPSEELYAVSIPAPEEICTGYCYRFDATDIVTDSCGGGQAAFIVVADKRTPIYRHRAWTSTVKARYPDLTLEYLRRSTQICLALAIFGFATFILSAIGIATGVTVTRDPAKQKKE